MQSSLDHQRTSLQRKLFQLWKQSEYEQDKGRKNSAIEVAEVGDLEEYQEPVEPICKLIDNWR